MRLVISRASHCLPSRNAACSWLQAYTSVSYDVMVCFLYWRVADAQHPGRTAARRLQAAEQIARGNVIAGEPQRCIDIIRRWQQDGFLRRLYAPFPCRACQIFSGVRGVSIWRTPTWDRASITALAMATGAASVGNSPMPFAPRGFMGDGVSRVSRVNAGVVLALGKA